MWRTDISSFEPASCQDGFMSSCFLHWTGEKLKTDWERVVFQVLLPALGTGLEGLKWTYEWQRKAGLAVTFSFPIRKPRCLIWGCQSRCFYMRYQSTQLCSGRWLLTLMHQAELNSVALAPEYCWGIHQITSQGHPHGTNQTCVILQGQKKKKKRN